MQLPLEARCGNDCVAYNLQLPKKYKEGLH